MPASEFELKPVASHSHSIIGVTRLAYCII
jgi:hypothetical protein